MIDRREFSTQLLAAGLSLGLAPLACAQGTPVEGQQYVRLSQPQPVLTPGKVEVIEFFWYGCPHCFEFEPMLEAWIKTLPADVAFRRVPVAFRDEPFTAHQKIFYALDAMGLVDSMQMKVFNAIHRERKHMDKPAEIAEFMQKNGVDSAKFMDIYNSFAVQTKTRQARALAEAYKIDGVPALGIGGRYYTSGSLAGSLRGSLQVADFLIQKSRKSA
ncbi:MAG TPA: thiol:disulfide interchange protein DsbA/DsbL [Burkholderiaceae bacterium]